jgi:hypothetical protein
LKPEEKQVTWQLSKEKKQPQFGSVSECIYPSPLKQTGLEVSHDSHIRRFEHKSKHTEKINAQYELIHDKIDSLADAMVKQMFRDKNDYLAGFEQSLRGLHTNYRELESQHNDLTSR